jgi:hypothetical protein
VLLSPAELRRCGSWEETTASYAVWSPTGRKNNEPTFGILRFDNGSGVERWGMADNDAIKPINPSSRAVGGHHQAA